MDCMDLYKYVIFTRAKPNAHIVAVHTNKTHRKNTQHLEVSAEPRSLMLPKSVAVLPCHLGWRTLLKCNKTNHACLPACLEVQAVLGLLKHNTLAYTTQAQYVGIHHSSTIRWHTPLKQNMLGALPQTCSGDPPPQWLASCPSAASTWGAATETLPQWEMLTATAGPRRAARRCWWRFWTPESPGSLRESYTARLSWCPWLSTREPAAGGQNVFSDASSHGRYSTF